MNLVYGDGRPASVVLPAPFHPRAVSPGIVQVPDDGGGPGRHLGAEGEGVGLVHPVAAEAGGYMVLVGAALLRPRDQSLPDPRASPGAEGMAFLVPPVEVAHHADALSVGGPHGKVRPLPRARPHRMRAQLLIQAEVGALVEEVEVLIAEEGHAMPQGAFHRLRSAVAPHPAVSRRLRIPPMGMRTQ